MVDKKAFPSPDLSLFKKMIDSLMQDAVAEIVSILLRELSSLKTGMRLVRDENFQLRLLVQPTLDSISMEALG